MPGKRSGVVSLLIPAIVLVPLGGVLLFVIISSWQAADSQAVLSARLKDSAASITREIGDSIERQKGATEYLSQSPLTWLWVKFQGERLTPSNRAHADISLKEIENYGRLLSFAQIYLASENTCTLYKDGAAVKRLMENDAADAWYFSALKSEEVLVTSDARGIRTSARVMDDGRVWGAVCLLSDVSALGASVLSNGSAGQGTTRPRYSAAFSAALVNAAGEAAGGGTLFDLYPAPSHAAVSGALDSLVSTDHDAVFMEAMGPDAGMTVAVRAPAPGWYLFVSSALVSPVNPSRLLWLGGVPAAMLLLLLLALMLTTGRRLRAVAALFTGYDRDLHAAGEELAHIGASARGAQTAAAQLQALAERLGAEAAAAATAGAEADALFSRAEARETELRAGIAGRLSLFGRLIAAAREAVERSRLTEAAARIVGNSASRAEEELSRVITLSSSTSHAVDKALKASSAIGEMVERIRLLSLNAALEAARGSGQGQGFARIADEVKSMADETAARARALSAMLTEAGGSVEGASRAAQEAGRAVHEASADASRAVGGGWEEVTELLSQTENANVSAARLKDDASSTDRGRSALEGFARIVARIGSLAAEIAHVAGRAGTDASAITRSVQKGKIS